MSTTVAFGISFVLAVAAFAFVLWPSKVKSQRRSQKKDSYRAPGKRAVQPQDDASPRLERPEPEVKAPTAPFQGTSASRRFLEATGPALGPGKVTDEEDAQQWRTEVEGVATRLRVEGSRVFIEMKAPLPFKSLELRWDPQMLPSEGPRDVWEDDPPVFVGPGLIISPGQELGRDPDDVVEKRLAVWSRLDAGTQEELTRMMTEGRVGELSIDARGASLELSEPLKELMDPKAQTIALVRALTPLLKELAAQPPLDGAVEVVMHKAQCSYCRSQFVWTHSPRCSNCGAPLSQADG